MRNAETIAWGPDTRQTSARVVEVAEDGLWLERGGRRWWADDAVAGAGRPRAGDEVVALRVDGGWCVVGVKRAAPREDEALVLAAGRTARVVDDGVLEVRDAGGALRLRLDGDQLEVLAGPEGDLILAAPAGSVRVAARDDVEVAAGRNLVQRAEAELRQEAARIDVRADQLFERTRDTVREVASLLLTRAGRVKTRVRETWGLRSKRTDIKSDKDTTIDGQRVLLG